MHTFIHILYFTLFYRSVRCHAAVPKVFCSEDSLFRRFVGPKVRWSEGLLIRILALIFQKNIGGRPHAGASATCTNSDKNGNSDHIVFVIVILTMVNAIISSPTSIDFGYLLPYHVNKY